MLMRKYISTLMSLAVLLSLLLTPAANAQATHRAESKSSGLRLTATTTDLAADGRSTTQLTATVVDGAGVPVADGRYRISFTPDQPGMGTLSPTTVYTTHGTAVTTFTAGIKPGQFAVTAAIMGDSNATAAVQLTLSAIMAPPLERPNLPRPPGLSINPVPANTVDDSITLTGLTINASTVLVNAQQAALLPDGTFTATVNLHPGPNVIVVTATNQIGLSTVQSVTIVRETLLAHLEIEPAYVTLARGQTQQFTVRGTDTYGNVLPVSGIQWRSSQGTMDGNGLYAATTAGTATVTATLGTLSASSTVSVFGTASKIALPTPANLVANGYSSTTITAEVQDADGNLVSDYNGLITFASSNVSAARMTVPTVNVVNGLANATIVAGTTAGSALISASANGLTAAMTQVSSLPQAVTRIVLSANPGTLSAGTGSQGTLIMTMKDQTDYPMIVAPSGSSQIGINLTSSNAGVIQFGSSNSTALALTAPTTSVVLNATTTAGSAIIHGSITSPAGLSATVTPVTVTTIPTGFPYKLSIDPIASVTAGATGSATVRVLDYTGHQVTTPNGTMQSTMTMIDSHGGRSTLGTLNLSYGAGVYTFTAPGVAGGYTLEATGSGLTTATGAFTVTSDRANKLSLAAVPWLLAADGLQTATLTASVLDRYGNLVTSGSYPITFRKTTDNHATQWPGDVTVYSVNGKATAQLVATTNQGTDTYTATSTGLVNAAASVTTAVIGASAQLKFSAVGNGRAGTSFPVDVQVLDATGTLNTRDNGRTITVKVLDGSTVATTATGTTINGVARVILTLNKAAAYDLTATAAGLADASGWVTVNAAAATQISLAANVDLLRGNGSDVTLLTASVLDAYGNLVTQGNYPVSFNIISGNDFMFLLETTANTVDGEAVVAAQTKNVTSNSTVTFTASASGMISGVTTVTVAVPGAPLRLAFIGIGTGAAGAPIPVKVAVQDIDGATMNDSGRAVTVSVKTGDTVITTATGTTFNGVAQVSLTIPTAGTYTLEATDNGVQFKPVTATITAY